MKLSSLFTTLLAFLLVPAALADVSGKLVEYKVGNDSFVGFLAWDSAVASDKTPRPGVLVCPEWWGCNEYAKTRAKQLAALGYVAFAIDVYGKGADGQAKTTEDPKEAGQWASSVMKDPTVARARAEAALKAFVANKMVDASHVAAIGYCMGGTVGLELARTGADLKAVVTFHTSTLTSKTPEDNKKIKATVMVCHGGDDEFLAPDEVTNFQKQMKEAGVDNQVNIYAGAVHSFTNKEADAHKMDGVKYEAKADRRSWENMCSLFLEKLGAAKTAKDTKPATQDLNK
jgi:dienelactone hydrolase